MAGYHLVNIKKGELGTLDKIREELEEAIDAEKQNCKIMLLLELSDLIGAIDAYLEKNFSTLSLKDLSIMAAITKRAFEAGER